MRVSDGVEGFHLISRDGNNVSKKSQTGVEASEYILIEDSQIFGTHDFDLAQ
jgi:hypothetical protein